MYSGRFSDVVWAVHMFGEWLYATPVSTAIRETSWIIPGLQSIHILAISVVVGSALATELRFAGLFATDCPAASIRDRFLPWMRWALLILLLTGLVLVIAEPGRTITNPVFIAKMALVAAASLVTLRDREKPLVSASTGVIESTVDVASKPLAWIMLLVWVIIIFCGRFIAYI